MKNKNHFTPRELQILKLISLGTLRKTIKDKLQISISTVDGHIHNLHLKSNTQTWGELVVFAKDHFNK